MLLGFFTPIILERAVGRGGVCGCGGAGQGATTPNSQSIQGLGSLNQPFKGAKKS